MKRPALSLRRVAARALLLAAALLLADLAAFGLLPLPLLSPAPTAAPVAASEAVAVLFHDFNPSSRYGISSETIRRLNHGIALWRQQGGFLIVAGGWRASGEPTGSRRMARYAREQGVPVDRILMEARSQDSFGNLAGIAAIMRAEGFRHVTLVSSPFHLKRLELVADRKTLAPFRLSPYPPEGCSPPLGRREAFASAHRNLAALVAWHLLPAEGYHAAVAWVREHTDF